MSTMIMFWFCVFIPSFLLIHSSEIPESTIQYLVKQLELTNARLKETEQIVHHLEGENKRYQNLELRMAVVEEQCTNMLSQMYNNEANATDLYATYDPQSAPKTQARQKTLKERPHNLFHRSIGTGPKIAFTVQNSYDMGHLGTGQTIVFDEVLTNIGGCYNRVTGIFTATISGVYAFFFDMRTMDHQALWVVLVKDGSNLLQTYTNTPEIKYYHRAESNFALIHLNQRNSIWLKIAHVENFSDAIDDHSSFSGFLLYPD